MPDQDDAPKPVEPGSRRGAGWADEDADWQHRDHGPRPEVPNHGARPFLMGVPILLITIAAIVAIAISSGKDDDGSGAAVPTAAGAATGGGVPAAFRAALANHAQLIAGLADPGLVAKSSCKPAGADLYDCTYGAGAKGGRTLEIEFKDGELSKRLDGDDAQTAPDTPEAVAALLQADDRASGETTKYACATSVAMNPDGSQTGGNASGFLCVQTAAGGGSAEEAIQRFVAFAADGTVSRDFALGGG